MSRALDQFFDHYYRRRPVTATFTGEHAYDALLPDWSCDGLESFRAEGEALIELLASDHPAPGSDVELLHDVDTLDAELARRFLDVQRLEIDSAHGVRGNPSLWTGEAIFAVISLMIRDFAPVGERMHSASRRLDAIPGFLDAARATLSFETPAAWTAKALRECEGASILLADGMVKWAALDPAAAPSTGLLDASRRAELAFAQFSDWLRARPAAPDSAMQCGAAMYDVLLDRAHWCDRSRGDLLRSARDELGDAQRLLTEAARQTAGSWPSVQEQLAAAHPSPEEYLTSFERVWLACRACANEHDVVTWGDWPIRYVPYPDWTARAAPYLYYLFYRSPAPLDAFDVYDYVVPTLPAENVEQYLRAWNDSVIKLNHVVHHGAIGHHVQNWHASTRCRSRVGRIAAVDAASRLAMLSAGTMAEGWACYATRLMEELGFLNPLERVSELHSRVRFLARAVVDIELHQGTMAFDDAARFWTETVGSSGEVARAEVIKASMFPCSAIMYWLGTEGIVTLRQDMAVTRGERFSLKTFHDDLLDLGSIPVALAARLMKASS